MVRAIFFDFYSVWAPDKLSYYLANAQLNGPEAYKSLYDIVEQYYHGQINLDGLTEALRVKLGHPDISTQSLTITEESIAGEVTNLIRQLHGHFIKIGVLANLGQPEAQLLNNFNQHNQLFEVIASPLTLQLPQSLLSQNVFAAALQAIGEPPESTLMVSGNPYLLAFASSFGISTLQFAGLPQLEQSLNQLLVN